MKTKVEEYFPPKSIKVFKQDKEWMTPKIQALRRTKAREYRRNGKSEVRSAPATPQTVGDNWGDVGIDSAIGIIGGPPHLEDCHPVRRSGAGTAFPQKRCGSAGLLGETAQATANRLTIMQESYDAKMHYAKTTQKIEILANAMRTGDRPSYSLSWWRWAAFRKGRNPPVCG